MEKLTLRKATDDDNEFAFQVKRAAMKDYVRLVWRWNENRQRQLHARRFGEQDFRIISLNGKDVGIMSVAVEPECILVNQLYILPDYQGRQVGRKCMLMVLDHAGNLGLPVRLRVLKVNVRAMTFYKRLGFTITEDSDTHVLMQHADGLT